MRVHGRGWSRYGDYDGDGHIPAGTELVFAEAEAAAFLKHRGSRNSAEAIEIFDDSDEEAAPEPGHAPRGRRDEQVS